MANKKFLVGMLVMVLVFGMSVVGCDNDGTTNGQYGLDGTWVFEGASTVRYVFSGDSFLSQILLNFNWVNVSRGSFSIAGGQIHFNITHTWSNNDWVENIQSISGSFSREGPNSILLNTNLFTRN